jgi:hypothetical protein
MLLMSSNESQAVLGRLFFSPSAATLCRGTPDPTLWLSGSARRPARAPAGPQPGPVQLGDVPGSSALGGAGRVGPGPGPGRARPGPRSGQARAQAGPGGPGRLALPGVPTTGRGGAAAGLPEFGTPGSARTVLTRVGHSVAVSVWCWRVCCLDDPARASRSRPGEECSASTPSRGSLGALWRRVASAAPGSGPFLCSERCAGLGGARAVGFTAGRSRWA